MSKLGSTLSVPVENKINLTLSAFGFIYVPTAFLKLNNDIQVYTSRT